MQNPTCNEESLTSKSTTRLGLVCVGDLHFQARDAFLLKVALRVSGSLFSHRKEEATPHEMTSSSGKLTRAKSPT
jgi:hypothetical protein